MKAYPLFSAAFLLLLSGCTKDATIQHKAYVLSMHVDPLSFSKADTNKLQHAADSIARLTEGFSRIDLVFDGLLQGSYVMQVPSEDARAKYCELASKTEGRLIAATELHEDGTRAVVILSDRISIEPSKFEAILMHEFGHAIGLPDIPNPDAIMADHTDLGVKDPTDWTAIDTSVCVAVGRCQPRE